MLLRTVKRVQGFVELTVDREPMFHYGRLAARWSYDGNGYGRVVATAPGVDLSLASPPSLADWLRGGRALARTTLRESERASRRVCLVGRLPAGVGRRRIRADGANFRALATLVSTGRFRIIRGGRIYTGAPSRRRR